MDIQFPEILFQIINFGVVVGALSYLLYKPIKKILDERSAKVEEGQKAAEQNIAERHQVEEMKKKAQKEAEKEAAKLLEEANQAAASRTNELLKKAKETAAKEAEKITQNAQEEADAHTDQIKKEFNMAVLETVAKIVGSLDVKAQQKLIDRELDQLLKRI